MKLLLFILIVININCTFFQTIDTVSALDLEGTFNKIGEEHLDDIVMYYSSEKDTTFEVPTEFHKFVGGTSKGWTLHFGGPNGSNPAVSCLYTQYYIGTYEDFDKLSKPNSNLHGGTIIRFKWQQCNSDWVISYSPIIYYFAIVKKQGDNYKFYVSENNSFDDISISHYKKVSYDTIPTLQNY